MINLEFRLNFEYLMKNIKGTCLTAGKTIKQFSNLLDN